MLLLSFRVFRNNAHVSRKSQRLIHKRVTLCDSLFNPGKNIRWDPANPTWDPRCVSGGIPPFSGGIPCGIMEHPAWDPTWDYGTSRMGSHMGSRQLKLGSRLKFLIASHLGKHIPGGIKPRIPPIPLGILPQISDSFLPGTSYPRWDCIWDPANPSLDPA